MAIYTFGGGSLWGIPSSPATLTNPANPVQFGTLQDVNLEFSGTVKQLHGQYQFPVAIGRGTQKVTGKAKFGQISGLAFTQLYFGGSLNSGQTLVASNEPQAIPLTTPWQVTVSNASGFVQDLGVINALTGLPLSRVTTAPLSGQYTVNATGLYTFASADAGKAVSLSYQYTVTSGSSYTISNALLGVTPTFQAVLSTGWNGKTATLTLNRCVSSKLSIATKLEDFAIPELDFECFADNAGSIGSMNFSEAS